MTNSFDHLLRDALKGTASPADSCLDAEVLAAWSEGTLDTAERAAAEAHAAECSRCQALLATMIRIDPPILTRPWWRSPAFGWLAPLTVAGAALAIWVSVDRTSMPNEASAVVPAPAATSPAPDAQARDQEEVRKARDSAIAAVSPGTSAPATRGPGPTAVEARRRAESTSNRQAAGSVPAPVVVESLPEAGAARADDPAMRRAAAAPAPLPPSQAAPPLAAAKSVAPPPPASPAATPAPSRSAETAAVAERSRAESVTADAVGRLATGLAQRDVLIRSADGQARWRITALGRLQRSADGGVTWAEEDTGHSGILTAGAAVSDTVCWLVGRAGVILLSTDGRSWRRVPFPEAVDLVSVAASDSRTATVTAAGGRRFTTTDGGVNWR